jgi:uncharacterized membrane protein YeaQ/YmgE (transglycosylase-associated protein family)
VNNSSTKWRITGLLVASAVASILGYYLDPGGFLVNVSAGLLGAAIGVWISIEVIEKFISEQQARQWKQVRQTALESIAYLLDEVTLEYAALLDSRVPMTELRLQLGQLTPAKANLVRAICETFVDAANHKTGEIYQELYDVVSPRLDRLGDLLLFYIMVPDQEPDLVKHLQELERIATDWAGATIAVKQTKLHPRELSQSAVRALQKISEVTGYMTVASTPR